MNSGKTGAQFVTTGVLFSALWASASVASKIGLQSAQPFVLSFSRFSLASLLMLIFSHVLLKKSLPKGKQWQQLAIFGLLNVALYLGLFILAIGNVSAGLGSLAVALNPVLITVLYAIFQKRSPSFIQIFSLVIGFGGVFICAYPLLVGSHASFTGILTLFLSMAVYSLGTIYYQGINWNGLEMITINGWQTLFGALFTLPVMLFLWQGNSNHFNESFWIASSWLAIMVSICAVLCWINLLHHNGEKSAYWLFLSPVFGFLYSHWLTNEPIGIFTLVGTMLVLLALWITARAKKRD